MRFDILVEICRWLFKLTFHSSFKYLTFMSRYSLACWFFDFITNNRLSRLHIKFDIVSASQSAQSYEPAVADKWRIAFCTGHSWSPRPRPPRNGLETIRDWDRNPRTTTPQTTLVISSGIGNHWKLGSCAVSRIAACAQYLILRL